MAERVATAFMLRHGVHHHGCRLPGGSGALEGGGVPFHRGRQARVKIDNRSVIEHPRRTLKVRERMFQVARALGGMFGLKIGPAQHLGHQTGQIVDRDLSATATLIASPANLPS